MAAIPALDAAPAGAVLYAKSLDVMRAFYADVFGATTADHAANYVALDLPGFRLLLHAMPPHIAESIVITRPPERREEAAMKLSLPVASLAEARTCAQRTDGMFDPEDSAWEWLGRRYCDAIDPEGNVVQCHEAASAPSRAP